MLDDSVRFGSNCLGTGVPQLRSVGELLHPHRPSAHRGPQDEQVPQELHHHRRELFPVEKAPRLYIADLILTTIPQEILQKYTARQLRLAFLTQLWNSKVDFSESLMTGEVKNIETTMNVRDPVRNSDTVLISIPFLVTELLQERQSACTSKSSRRSSQ